MIPLSVPALPTGGDQIAMAYRAFDHWQKYEHADCEHDSILDCIEVYAQRSGGIYDELGISPEERPK